MIVLHLESLQPNDLDILLTLVLSLSLGSSLVHHILENDRLSIDSLRDRDEFLGVNTTVYCYRSDAWVCDTIIHENEIGGSCEMGFVSKVLRQ